MAKFVNFFQHDKEAEPQEPKETSFTTENETLPKKKLTDEEEKVSLILNFNTNLNDIGNIFVVCKRLF